MSFVGGGSDMADYYRHGPGMVVSTAINKYIYVTVNKKFDNGIRVAYSKTEEVESAGQLDHKLVRAALNYLKIEGGVEITTVADIPSRGTGLGSSSTFTVALLHGLQAFQGKNATAAALAKDACHIEIGICGEPIGKQDQYAAAFGGFNTIEFFPDETVKVTPIIAKPHTLEALEGNLLMLYTGITRSASELLQKQGQGIKTDRDKRDALGKMVGLCTNFQFALQNNNPDEVGPILHENWLLKKTLAAGVSTSIIDDWYAAGLKAGATGGKILGAGAGGFLLFYAPRDRHERICHALPQLRRVPFQFERFGSQIIFFNPTK
jgi:D-glycero-alpha-D-manno-heptose-7-phosphate kinase